MPGASPPHEVEPIRRSSPLALLLALVLLVLGAPAPAAARTPRPRPQPPTIVVIVVDDLADVGNELWERLPAIKRIFLDRGLTLTNAFAETPLCCPARANLLSGLHTHHHGVIRNEARLFDPSRTIATVLDDAGYHTIFVGKYFNGTGNLDDKTPPGWDRFAGYGGRYYNYKLWVEGEPEQHGSLETDYSTDVIRKRAKKWVLNAPAGDPLFVYLAPFAPHANISQVPYRPTPAARHNGDPRCAGLPPFFPPNYNEADVSDKPPVVAARRILGRYRTGWPLVDVCESLLSVNEMVGAVEGELKKQGRLDNTVWVLLSDNGMAFGQHRWTSKNLSYATDIPLFLSGRGIERGTSDAMVSIIDLAPTLARIAGTKMTGVDGINLYRPTLRTGGLSGRTRMLEQNLEPGETKYRWQAIRTEAWHWIEWEDGSRELYDLVADPWELENLAGTLPEVEAQLADELQVLLGDGPAARRAGRR